MSGTGAFRSGGRWNSPGRHVVYASGHLSLAMLELLVHVDDAEALLGIPHSYRSIGFTADDVATLAEDDLPSAWNARPEARASKLAGDEWLDSRSTLVLAVPSVIVPPDLRYEPSYLNYLINPRHPAFAAAITLGGIRELIWDPRLVR